MPQSIKPDLAVLTEGLETLSRRIRTHRDATDASSRAEVNAAWDAFETRLRDKDARSTLAELVRRFGLNRFMLRAISPSHVRWFRRLRAGLSRGPVDTARGR